MPPVGPTRGRRNKKLIVLGATLAVVGVIAAVAMAVAAFVTYQRAVEDLARAPIGCTTTLRFDRTGTFVVFLETKGEIDSLSGDCPSTGEVYDYQGSERPAVDLALAGPDGAAVSITSGGAADYDLPDRTGAAVGSVEIGAAGEYTLTVRSEQTGFVVAVGRDPNDSPEALVATGLVVGGVLVLVGVIVLVLGLRRKRGPDVQQGAVVPARPAGTSPWGPPSA
jgi:hypothetical protein